MPATNMVGCDSRGGGIVLTIAENKLAEACQQDQRIVKKTRTKTRGKIYETQHDQISILAVGLEHASKILECNDVRGFFCHSC